jgi:hypothetical protein
MYNEDSYSKHLTWLKVKRTIFMILFSIIGCIIGVFLSAFIIEVLMCDVIFRPIIITISTLLFFFISLVTTSNTSREVQDGYWKVAVLRKLTLISKKLDALDYLSKLENLDKLEMLNNLELLNNLENISKKLDDTSLISEKENQDIEKERLAKKEKK